MRMQKRQFRIGDLAKHLAVEKFVIRFWEKEFGVTTTRSNGGQRFYSEEDLDTFKKIKTLLYDEGFTIAGAKKQLSHTGTQNIVGSTKTTLPADETKVDEALQAKDQEIKALKAHILLLKEQFKKLKELL
jgi:DNA-binding transcriptional MerR regulator